MKQIRLNEQTLIAYRDIQGEWEKPALVFLHEGLGCSELWKGFPDTLCQLTGCPGLLYDRPGYGRSSALNKKFSFHFMHHHALCELPRIISMLIPQKRYILIGHSDGGSIALIHASERDPDAIALIAEAAHVFVEKETQNNIRKAVAAFESGQLNGLHRYHGEKTSATFNAWSDIWLSEGFSHWNIETALPSIQVPVLAIQGKEDPYGTGKQVEKILSGIPGSVESLLLDNCGHTPHREQEIATLNGMARFIRHLIEHEGG